MLLVESIDAAAGPELAVEVLERTICRLLRSAAVWWACCAAQQLQQLQHLSWRGCGAGGCGGGGVAGATAAAHQREGQVMLLRDGEAEHSWLQWTLDSTRIGGEPRVCFQRSSLVRETGQLHHYDDGDRVCVCGGA